MQPPSGTCAGCGATELLPLERIAELWSTGLGLVRKKPPTGARDTAELVATALAVLGGATVGAVVGGGLLALAGFLLPGIIGYAQQRRRLRRGRTTRLRPVPPTAPPARFPHVGIAEPGAATVSAPLSGMEALVASTAAVNWMGEVFFRHLTAADFCLVTDGGERWLVTGEVCVWPPVTRATAVAAPVPTHRILSPLTPAHLAALGLPPAPIPPDTIALEHVVVADQRIEAAGELRHEILPAIGYRDTEAPVLRGKPGMPIHLRCVVPLPTVLT